MRHNNWSWWAATADETRVWWNKRKEVAPKSQEQKMR